MNTPDELYNFLDYGGFEYEVVEVFEGVRLLRIQVNDEPQEEDDETGT